MENIATIATGFLGFALIFVIVGFVIYLLANQGYNSDIKLKHKNNEIEVHAENSNSTKIK